MAEFDLKELDALLADIEQDTSSSGLAEIDDFAAQIRETPEKKSARVRRSIEAIKASGALDFEEPDTTVNRIQRSFLKGSKRPDPIFDEEIAQGEGTFNPLEQFITGLTFGRDIFNLDAGEAEGFTENATKIIGNILSGIVIAKASAATFGAATPALAGFLPAGIRGSTVVSKVLPFLGRNAAEAGAVAALSPEEDIKFELGATFLADFLTNTASGRGLLSKMPALFRISKAKAGGSIEELAGSSDEVVEGQSRIFKEMQDFQTKVSRTKVDNATAFEKKIKRANKLFDEIKVERRKINRASEKAYKKAMGLIEEDVTARGVVRGTRTEELFNQARDQADAEIENFTKNFFEDVNIGALDDAQAGQIKGIADRLEGLELKYARGRELKDMFLSRFDPDAATKPINDRILTQPLPDEAEQAFSEVTRRLERASDNILAGLPPTATEKQLAARIAKIRKTAQQNEQQYLDSPKMRDLKKQAHKVMSDLLDDPDRQFTKEFPATDEFIRFMKGVDEVAAIEMPIDNVNKFKDIVEGAKDATRQVSKRVMRDLREATDIMPKDQEEALESVSNLIQLGGLENASRNQLAAARRGITSLLNDFVSNNTEKIMVNFPNKQFRTEHENLLKQLTQAEADGGQEAIERITAEINQLKEEFTRTILSDTATGAALFDNIGNSALRKMHLTFRALHGEVPAQQRLKFEDMLFDPSLDLRLATKELLNQHGTPNQKLAQFKNIRDLTPIQASISDPRQVARMADGTTLRFVTDNVVTKAEEAVTGFRRGIQEIMEPKTRQLDEIWKNLGDDTAERASQFIRDVGARADELIQEKGSTPEVFDEIEGEISRKLSELSPEVREAYNAFRRVADDTLEYINGFIRKRNAAIQSGKIQGREIPEVTRRPGYFPHIWEGSYTIRKVATDANGKLRVIGHIENADSNAEAISKMKEYLKANPRDNGRIIVTPKILASTGDDLDHLNTANIDIRELDRLYGLDASEVRDKLLGSKPFRSEQFQQLFFSGRYQRTANKQEFIQDPLKALKLYMYSGMKFAHHLEFLDEAATASRIAKSSTDANGKRMTGYAKWFETYANDIVGRPRNIQKQMDEYIMGLQQHLMDMPGVGSIMRSLGFTPKSRISSALISTLLTFGRFATIGINPATAIINTSLLATNVAPTLGFKAVLKATAKGGKHVLGRKALPETYQKLIRRSGIDIFQGGATLREVIQSPLLNTKSKQTLDTLDHIAMWGFNKTEKATRVTTLIAARDEADNIAKKLAKKLSKNPDTELEFAERIYKESADRLGMKLGAEAVNEDFAVEFMKATNFDFDMTGLSQIFRNPTAKPFLQFKTFMKKELEFVFGGIAGGQRRLTGKDQLKVLGMFTALGGMFSFPGIHAVDMASTSVFGFSPKKTVQNHFSEVLAAGMPRMLGIDISNRLAIDDLQFALDPKNLFGIAPYTFAESMSALYQGDTRRAAATLTPPAIRNVYRAMEFADVPFVDDKSGEIRSAFSGDLIVTEKDMDQPIIQTAAMLLGFEPDAVHDARTVDHHMRILENKLNRRRRLALRDAAEAMRNGNNQRLKKLQKDYDLTNADVKRATKSSQMTREERMRRNLPQELRHEDVLDLLED